MSFLNSVLSTINNKDNTAQAPRSAAPVARPKPAHQPSGLASNGTQQTRPEGQGTLKRKAEQDGPPTLKVPKTASTTSSVGLPSRSNTSSPAARSSNGLPKPAEPYRGTSRPTVKTNGLHNTSMTKPSPKPVAQTPTTPASSAPAPAKKGYLAMLERARMAQEANKGKGVGEIKHIKVEKRHLSRKEKERLAAEAKAAQRDPKLKDKLQPAGRSRDSTPTNAGGKLSDGKKKVDTGYKGTMRPAAAAPAYKGTMRPGGPSKPASSTAKGRPGEQSRHRYVEDYSDEEEEEEDEDDYDSASSDMEAGLNDIDQEELMSARVARKEDEEALREEEELKRQKLERKKKLLALSAAAAKKKKVY